jgi:hypothetical protein
VCIYSIIVSIIVIHVICGHLPAAVVGPLVAAVSVDGRFRLSNMRM